MEKVTTKTNNPWRRRAVMALIAIAAVALGVIVALRAVDTGSLGQYALALILLGVAGNRGVAALKPYGKK